MAADPASNVSPLDESSKTDSGETYIGTRCEKERVKRYDLARIHGDYEDRAAFILAACDALADQILGHATTATSSA